MFKKTVFLILSFSAMLLAAGGSQANTISMDTYTGAAPGDLTCNGGDVNACFGITGAVGAMGSGDASFSSTNSDEQMLIPSNPTTELARLNALLQSFDPALLTVTLFNKTDGAGSGFTTDKEYFSIKQATDTFYFKNNSGGSLTIALVGGTEDYSHWTEYGETVVPVPAAVWLFGSGLLGLIGVARRRKA